MFQRVSAMLRVLVAALVLLIFFPWMLKTLAMMKQPLLQDRVRPVPSRAVLDLEMNYLAAFEDLHATGGIHDRRPREASWRSSWVKPANGRI